MKALTCLLCQKMNLCQLFNSESFKAMILKARSAPTKRRRQQPAGRDGGSTEWERPMLPIRNPFCEKETAVIAQCLPERLANCLWKRQTLCWLWPGHTAARGAPSGALRDCRTRTAQPRSPGGRRAWETQDSMSYREDGNSHTSTNYRASAPNRAEFKQTSR